MFEVKKLLRHHDIILASQSPRRKELFSMICDSFKIIPAQGEEIAEEGISVEEIPCHLALDKCREVAQDNPGSLVIGCDTAVMLDGIVLGKPCSEQDAFDMLSFLSGKTHKVISGTAIYFGGQYHCFKNVTEVAFKDLSQEDIAAYIATGEPFDKAGAYGIQGYGSLLVKAISGDYFNVVGLPLSQLADRLCEILG